MGIVKSNYRLYLIYFFFACLFLITVFRIGYLQIIRAGYLKNFAHQQYQKKILVTGERGRIYDRRGRVLATNINTYSVYIDPLLVKERKKIISNLARILNLKEKDLWDKIDWSKRFVWIKRKISVEEKEKLARLKLKGVGFLKEKLRFYPQEYLLAHILGGVNIDNEGLEGIELFYDEFLRGKKGKVSIVTDSQRKNLFVDPYILHPKEGADLYLTVDTQIQYWVERYLEETIKKYKAKAGSVVVMDPFNGDILALANWPRYDPNHLSNYPSGNLRNIAITDMFEPGSVFKIVTLIAALDKNVFSLDDKIFCENGRFKIPGTTLNDWKPYGELTFKEVFKKSSNIGVAKIASALGPGTIYQYIKRLGFGEKTGIDLSGESAGLVKSLHHWSKTSPYIIPIGQEIGVTVLQLARLMSAVVNGGYLIRPHLIRWMVGRYGFRKEYQPIRKKVLSPSLTKLVKEILIEVVEDGTAKLARIDNFTVGGKTGTAQKFDTKLHRYSPYAYRASFVGFVEKGDDIFVICVSIDEPQKSHFGGVVAAPLFKEIAQKVVDYIRIEERLVKR